MTLRRPLAFAAVFFAVLSIIADAPPVEACSSVSFDDVQESYEFLSVSAKGELIGFYRYETLAYAPSLFIRGERSASVVIEYWGIPPDHLGPHLQGLGGVLTGFSNCGSGVAGVGEVGASWVSDFSPTRGQTAGDVDVTAADRAYLEDLFGPSTHVPRGATSIVRAHLLLWIQPILVSSVALAAGLLWRRWRHRRAAIVPAS